MEFSTILKPDKSSKPATRKQKPEPGSWNNLSSKRTVPESNSDTAAETNKTRFDKNYLLPESRSKDAFVFFPEQPANPPSSTQALIERLNVNHENETL